ncbi:MAG: serine/threonine protein kinase [Rhodopirellula sp.]|nr:serine/threonine protein kinase [Rhodopirellula sp.]
MRQPVVAVESNEEQAESQRPAGGNVAAAAGSSPVRFTYPSGSRPLEGFTIKRGVGHGGFGEVYYATSDAGKEVALKLIRRNLDVELRGIRQCLNLKHPDLVAVFDIRQDARGDNWVVMEYVGGRCLEAVISSHPDGVPVDEALAWFHGIVAGVAYLHDHGIVHRDLKPGNIFSDEGLVKIGDYGLSKFISCSRRSGQTESIGTIHYMAPEVANGRYGKEIDIYALGVILYEMLTGHVPFEGESVGEVLMKHLTAAPDVSRLDEPYRSVVAKALDKDPGKRFRSVGEMLDALPEPVRTHVDARPLPHGIPGRRGAGGAQYVAAEAVDEEAEPIGKAVRQVWRRLLDNYNRSRLNTPTKLVLLVCGLFVLLSTSGAWLPLVVVLLILYACYWLTREIVLTLNPRRVPLRARSSPPPVPGSNCPTEAHFPPAGPRQRAEDWRHHADRPHAAVRRRRWNEPAAAALPARSPRERTTELFGSMVGGALTAMTMCLVMIILNSFRSAEPRPEQYAWLLVVSIAGTWAVMIPAKFWEGLEGDAMVRRFVLMVIGLGLGALAYLTAEYLDVRLPYDPKFAQPHSYQLPPSFYRAGQPLVMAYLACFGTLFVLIRWWRQADPLRTTRMSLGAMVVSVVVAWLVAAMWVFPQPWLMMAAGAISASVQLASPWVHPKLRLSNGRMR